MLLSPFSLASKVQIFHPFARCFCACFRGLYKPYWKGFPLRMLKTLLKAWKTRLYGQFSTVSGGVFNILWKTFQHNSTDKHPRSLGKLPVLPPFLRVKLTIITGVLPVFSLSTGFPHPVCGQKAKSSSCMLNAKISHKIHPVQAIPAAANQSAAARRTGAALLPPPPYSITTATANRGCCTGPYPMSTEFV